jgi:hypothetical protein
LNTNKCQWLVNFEGESNSSNSLALSHINMTLITLCYSSNTIPRWSFDGNKIIEEEKVDDTDLMPSQVMSARTTKRKTVDNDGNIQEVTK